MQQLPRRDLLDERNSVVHAVSSRHVQPFDVLHDSRCMPAMPRGDDECDRRRAVVWYLRCVLVRTVRIGWVIVVCNLFSRDMECCWGSELHAVRSRDLRPAIRGEL